MQAAGLKFFFFKNLILKETQWAQINAIGYNKCHVRTERTHTHTQKRQMYFFPKMIFNYSFFLFHKRPYRSSVYKTAGRLEMYHHHHLHHVQLPANIP